MEFNLKNRINFYITKCKNLFSEILKGNGVESLIRPIMPELDFIRGIAISAVVLYHGFDFIAYNNLSEFHGLGKIIILSTKGGWLGVHLFFVLSGFLITGILIDTKERSDYFKRFYSRRALRILPVYIALLSIIWILGVAQWPFLLTCILFVSNLSVFFGVALQYGPLWTLAIEEQFYLLWPQAVRRLSRKSLTILALLIVVLTPVIRWIAFFSGHPGGLYLYTWFLFDGLALGALLAIYLRSKQITRQKAFHTGLILIATGLCVIAVGAPFGILSQGTTIGSIFQLVPFYILFAGAITISLIIGTSKLKRIVLWGWLRYLGRISYGLYIIHLLVFNIFDKIVQNLSPSFNTIMRETISGLIFHFIIVGGISIIIAAISREYFEEFFLKLKDQKFAETVKINILSKFSWRTIKNI